MWGALDLHAIDAAQKGRTARIDKAASVHLDEEGLVAKDVEAARVEHLCGQGQTHTAVTPSVRPF